MRFSENYIKSIIVWLQPIIQLAKVKLLINDDAMVSAASIAY